MKQILLTFLMMVMLLSSVTSCSKSKEEEPKIYATESEIQGKWGCIGQYASYIIVFDKPSYSIFVKSGKETQLENGTYTFGANSTITLTKKNGKESDFSPLEDYWEGSTKSALHFWPVGSFVRMK